MLLFCEVVWVDEIVFLEPRRAFMHIEDLPTPAYERGTMFLLVNAYSYQMRRK
jgi:hypothetical protein